MIFEVENKKVFSPDIGKSFDKNNHSVILLHGSGQSHVVWSLTDQYIADQGFNVFALDFPGHGNSEGSCLKSIEEMSIWLNKVVEHIGIKDLTLVGHSQGCLIALEYINKFPEKIKNYYRNYFANLHVGFQILTSLLVVFLIYQIASTSLQPFIYFQF